LTLPPLPARWHIGDAELLSDGIGGKVWRVTLADGSSAALKQASKAARPEIELACAYLEWADGSGAARLLDRYGDLLLLEWAGDRTLLDELRDRGDDHASEIAAATVAALHSASDAAPASTLTPLAKQFDSLFRKVRADETSEQIAQYRDAADMARLLLADQQDARPLHGDIHHENILASDRGWLAIDPKGLFGDPGYDTANLFYNPYQLDLPQSVPRAMSMATILGARLRRDPARLLDWAFAYSALSAVWWLEDGNEAEALRGLSVGRAVREAARQIRS
jgi:streptomycin 6-kinase